MALNVDMVEEEHRNLVEVKNHLVKKVEEDDIVEVEREASVRFD